MISEINELALGIDLGPVNSQLTFYNRQNSGPRTVSVVPGEENYQIATPAELFSLMEQRLEEGVALLADFFAQCLELLATAGKPDSILAVVTMRKMNGTWADGIRAAFERVGVPKDHVFLQDYRESFYWYMLNQRKDLWTYQVALFSCENGKVTAFEFSVERKTRPALVSIGRKACSISMSWQERADPTSSGWKSKTRNSWSLPRKCSGNGPFPAFTSWARSSIKAGWAILWPSSATGERSSWDRIFTPRAPAMQPWSMPG